MDKLERYREIIKNLLTKYHNLSQHSICDDVEGLLAFDEERDQYLWFQTGWHQQKRIRGITVHIRIKNEKVWVEEDWTDLGVVDDLLANGIPSTEIVLGFQPPDVRQHTEFAIA
jgi:hypothetical protein